MKKLLLLVLGIILINSSLPAQWQQMKGPEGVSVKCFAFDDTKVFAGTDKGLFVSSDEGINWKEAALSLKGFDVRSIAVHEGKIYAGTLGNGVFLSEDTCKATILLRLSFGGQMEKFF